MPVILDSELVPSIRSSVFSTGYVSWRSEKHGSWYVSKLCEVLKEEADKSDLKSIMTRVAGEVGKAYTSDGYKQMPHECATLTKLLKFL